MLAPPNSCVLCDLCFVLSLGVCLELIPVCGSPWSPRLPPLSAVACCGTCADMLMRSGLSENLSIIFGS